MSEAGQEDHHAGAGERRNRSIRRAVITSLASKAGTALLQLVSIPIAIRVLGREEFGLYASISMVITMVILLEIGVGPALTHGLSQASARGQRRRQREYYSTSFFLMLALGAIGGLALLLATNQLPPAVVFGEAFSEYATTLRPALWLGIGLFTAVFVLGHTDRVREGYLEVGHNNLWGAAGNLLAAFSIAIGIWFFPNISFLLLAVFGSQVLARLANTLHLWCSRPYLLPRLSLFRPAIARALIKDGLAFSAALSVVGLVEYNLATNLVGRIGGPEAVAVYSVMITICISALGFVVMVTNPTWPALVDARARGDLEWIRLASRRLYRLALGVGAIAFLGLAVLGPVLLPLWLGAEFNDVGRVTLAAFGVYFIAHLWRHVGHILLMGIGRVGCLARVQLAESALILIPATAGMQAFGIPGLFIAMALTIASMTGWALPWMFARSIGKGAKGQGTEVDDALLEC